MNNTEHYYANINCFICQNRFTSNIEQWDIRGEEICQECDKIDAKDLIIILTRRITKLEQFIDNMRNL